MGLHQAWRWLASVGDWSQFRRHPRWSAALAAPAVAALVVLATVLAVRSVSPGPVAPAGEQIPIGTSSHGHPPASSHRAGRPVPSRTRTRTYQPPAAVYTPPPPARQVVPVPAPVPATPAASPAVSPGPVPSATPSPSASSPDSTPPDSTPPDSTPPDSGSPAPSAPASATGSPDPADSSTATAEPTVPWDTSAASPG